MCRFLPFLPLAYKGSTEYYVVATKSQSTTNAMKSFKSKRNSSSSGDRPPSASAPQSGGSSNAASAAAAAAALSPRSSASATTPTSSGNNDQFSARRSARVSTKKFAEGDNDTWHENLAVIENPQASASAAAAAAASSSGRSSNDTAGNGTATDGTAEAIPQLTLRSYFQSKSTGQRVWDEPPSGASNVVYASEEVRRMAMIQMEDLQVSTDVVRAASDAARAEDGDDGDGSGGGDMKNGGGRGGKSTTKPKVLGRFKIGRKQSSNSTEDGDNAKSNKKGGQRQRKIRYKPGRAPYGATAAYSQSIDEAQLERARMLSLQELGGGGGTDDAGDDNSNRDDGVEAAIAAARMNGDVVPSLPITQSEEEEAAAIQMAMAISLSEAEAQRAELSPMAASIDDVRREAAVARPDAPEESDYQYGNRNKGNGSSSLRYRGKPSKPTDDDRKPSARNLC